MAACAAAHAVTVLLMKRSILTEKIARRGHHVVREYRVDPFALTRVADVMTRTVETVPSTMTLHEAARFLVAPERRHPSFPVVDADGQVRGIVDPPSVIRWRRAGRHRDASLTELLSPRDLHVAHPDEYLDAVADRLMEANLAHIPVVARGGTILAGYLGWKDLMRAKRRLEEQESNRTAFWGLWGRDGAGTRPGQV